MTKQFTEEAYYHDDMELWTGDCPDKILLTPEAAAWAFDGVPLDRMEEGIDCQLANDNE